MERRAPEALQKRSPGAVILGFSLAQRHSQSTDAQMNNLVVEVDGDDIIVTRTGTTFSAAYHKPDGLPHIVMLRGTNEPSAPIVEVYEFRAAAFQAAVSKARELGWIM